MEKVKLSLFTDVMILNLKITGTPQKRYSSSKHFQQSSRYKITTNSYTTGNEASPCVNPQMNKGTVVHTHHRN